MAWSFERVAGPFNGRSGGIAWDGRSLLVSAVAVGRDRPGRVGGRVEVTKRTGVRVATWGTTFTHEARTRLASRIDIRSDFMQRFYFGMLKPF